MEITAVLLDYLTRVAGSSAAATYQRWGAGGSARPPARLVPRPEERRRKRLHRPAFWVATGNTWDRATCMLPDLRRKRMDALGISFSVLYPTAFGCRGDERDPDMRWALCRAINTMQAELYAEHADRMTPAAVIPMHSPEEGIRELEHAVEVLGLKAIQIASNVARPIPALAEVAPQLAHLAPWIDLLALDSDYDYDPFWRRCVELGVAVTAHAGSLGWQSRRSISNYSFNHMGHFALANDAFCKALVVGGVPARFPGLQVAFLEGGVSWAAQLLCDLKSHWSKRRRAALTSIDPSRMDRDLLRQAFRQHGNAALARYQDQVDAIVDAMTCHYQDWALLDEWGAAGLRDERHLTELFTRGFYFGCEADDPMTAVAFNGTIGARLKALFSSDIGHLDVPDMAGVIDEAYELVERGQLNERDFRDLTFTNAVLLHGRMNAGFFTGTAVEQAAAEVLAADSGA